MRPLPRVHAFTSDAVVSLPDFAVRAAAIASGGSAVALHARVPNQMAATLASVALRLLALARPPEAAVFVSRRSDLAAAIGAQGVQLGRADLTPADARRVFGRGWIGSSVHSEAEGEQAVASGAEYLVVGNVYETNSHPGRPAGGLELIHRTVRLGVPVIAIGGVTPDRAVDVLAAGAYGVAAISSLWNAADPAAATLEVLGPWLRSV